MTKSEQMKKDEKINEKIKSSKLECYRSGYRVGATYGIFHGLIMVVWAICLMTLAFVILDIPETGPPNRDIIIWFGIAVSSALFYTGIGTYKNNVIYRLAVHFEEERLLKKRKKEEK